MTGASLRRFSIGHKLAALTAVGVIATVVVAAVGRHGLQTVHARISAQVVTSEGLRNHMDGDMMHDALRADVLAALEARTAADRATVRQDVADHSAQFRADIAKNKQLDLPESVTKQLASIGTPLDAYITSANQMVNQALANPVAAQSHMAEFTKRFQAMETAQANVSDAIVKASNESKTKAAASVKSAERMQVIAVILLVAVLIALAVQITRRITRPLRASVDSLRALADKDLTKTLEVDSQDELRQMADALNTAFASLGGALASITGDSETVGTAASELAAISEQIQANAAESASQATAAAVAGDEVSASVASVATAIEEMTATVNEIAGGTAAATRVAQEAVQLAEATTQSVARLGEASTEIGNVVQVITSIAEQTNLLALNATIEAARAGDAGKGFAVVAGEVKDLATATAKATDDISRRVEAVQAETQDAVASIAQIAEIIERISEHQTSVSSAVEEQAATTAEIGRSVSEAARATNRIAESISGVAAIAASTAEGVSSAQQSAGELARVSEDLNRLVGEFRF